MLTRPSYSSSAMLAANDKGKPGRGSSSLSRSPMYNWASDTASFWMQDITGVAPMLVYMSSYKVLTKVRLVSGVTWRSPCRASCHTFRSITGRNGSMTSSTNRMALPSLL